MAPEKSTPASELAGAFFGGHVTTPWSLIIYLVLDSFHSYSTVAGGLGV